MSSRENATLRTGAPRPAAPHAWPKSHPAGCAALSRRGAGRLEKAELPAESSRSHVSSEISRVSDGAELSGHRLTTGSALHLVLCPENTHLGPQRQTGMRGKARGIDFKTLFYYLILSAQLIFKKIRQAYITLGPLLSGIIFAFPLLHT